MQKTGVVRKIDELGRIVIPKEIRRSLSIKDGEEIEIFIESENIVLKKFHRLLGFKEIAITYLSILNKLVESTFIITDREKIIAVNKGELKELENAKISSYLSSIIEERKDNMGVSLNLQSIKVIKGSYYIKPFVLNADLIGSIICISNNEISSQDKLLVNLLDSLLKTKIEAD